MNIPKKLKKEALSFAIIGLISSILGATLPIDIGGTVLTSEEAWAKGIAPTMVAFGITLAFFCFALLKGARWTKWPMILWLPVYFVVGVIVTLRLGQISYFEISALIAPIVIIWLWFVVSMFAHDETKRFLSGSK